MISFAPLIISRLTCIESSESESKSSDSWVYSSKKPNFSIVPSISFRLKPTRLTRPPVSERTGNFPGIVPMSLLEP